MQEGPEEACLREMAKKCRLLANDLHNESAAASLRKRGPSRCYREQKAGERESYKLSPAFHQFDILFDAFALEWETGFNPYIPTFPASSSRSSPSIALRSALSDLIVVGSTGAAG